MYTIDDLKGKYVKVGTPEADIFLDVCNKLGVKYASNETVNYTFIEAIFDDGELILYGLSVEKDVRDESKPFTPKQEWSIYTNDKPLCELSDEQAASLFNAWRNSGIRQCLGGSGWCDLPYKANAWFCERVYRIKQKSERELFIDSAMQLMTSETERTLEQQFGALFDSGKFKLVKGGE